ncbi:MAG: hypothetical protein HKL80_02605 [Acidimicrobiales bacterium]|nr:hypothetical protein [Acidimicrobiales bacterium]
MSSNYMGATVGNATGSQLAVETHGLVKNFGNNVAVNNVELLVPRGCAFATLDLTEQGKLLSFECFLV